MDESFIDCLKRAYKDDFGVDLTLADPPQPLTTYVIRDEDEHRVIPGIIFVAGIADEEAVIRNFSHEKHSEILWIDPAQSRIDPQQCVPDFVATLHLAVKAWERWRRKA